MMTDALLLECESIRETFRGWHDEHDSLDDQLAESIAALAAYQSHLDTWQQQLAGEREELLANRVDFEQERAGIEQSQNALEKLSAESSAELSTAHEKIAGLSTSLLERTEELRATQQQRAELMTELELMRSRDRERNSALDEQKRNLEAEREHWAEELRQLRKIIDDRSQVEKPRNDHVASDPQRACDSPRSAAPAKDAGSPGESPVLGSIMEQFGKLRQQRAIDREIQRKAR